MNGENVVPKRLKLDDKNQAITFSVSCNNKSPKAVAHAQRALQLLGRFT